MLSASVVSVTRLGMVLKWIQGVLQVFSVGLGGSWKAYWHHVCYVFEVSCGMSFTRRSQIIHADQAFEASEALCFQSTTNMLASGISRPPRAKNVMSSFGLFDKVSW